MYCTLLHTCVCYCLTCEGAEVLEGPYVLYTTAVHTAVHFVLLPRLPLAGSVAAAGWTAKPPPEAR